MLAYGGQTALNCGVKLDEAGILQKYGIKVLGTQIPGIQKTEDRQLFKDSMGQCDIPVLKSKTVTNFEDSKKIATEFDLFILHLCEQLRSLAPQAIPYNRIIFQVSKSTFESIIKDALGLAYGYPRPQF